MGKYILKRLLITIPVIVCVAILIFTVLFFTPGDPAVLVLGDTATAEDLAAYRAFLGIDRPYIVQLGDFLHKLFIKFDLGESWIFKTNISEEIAYRLPRTFAVCVYSIVVSILIGVPLGVAAAVHQNGIIDKIVLFLSSVMMCIPGYVFALMMIVQFSLKWRILPPYGIGGIEYYIMPCLAILITSFAGMARQMRSSMLEVIRSDYVMAARAQGFSRGNINYRHALPNALIPIITMVGGHFAAGLGGTMILETIFSIPGMGLYIQEAIGRRDIPVVTGCVVFLAIWFCLIMLLVDVLYALADPRIRAQYEAQGKGFFRKRRAKEE